MMFILSILLNVVLLAVLLYVSVYRTDFLKRARAHVMCEPYIPARLDADCVASWNNCIEKLDTEIEVVFFGDSHTTGGDWQKAYPNVRSINLGYLGEDTKGMIRRVDAIKAVRPQKIFLMGGINGLKDQSLEEFEYWYAALVDAIRREVPEAKLYVESILPVASSSEYCDNTKIREANRIILQITEARGLEYIDLYSLYAKEGALPRKMSYDGLHLKQEEYSIWYNTLRPYVESSDRSTK